jgi:hypothetical protein
MSKLANNSANFFKVDVWEAQGFIDGGVKRWNNVKNKPVGQKILVRTGRLRRSGQGRAVSSSRAYVTFDAPYASFVNAKRQFIGNSKELDAKNEKTITAHLDKILK